MITSRFQKCLVTYSLFLIFLECITSAYAVENWNEDDKFNSGRKLMGSHDRNGGEFIFYFIGFVIITLVTVCCRVYCKRTCGEECECDDDSCDRCCNDCCDACWKECCDGECGSTNPSLANPIQSPYRHSIQQQPLRRNFPVTNYGDLSTNTNAIPSFNRTNLPSSQNTATIFATESSIAPVIFTPTRASQLYQEPSAPVAHQVYNVPTTPIQLHSVVAEDAPPDYASVVLGDLTRGEHTPYPKVIQQQHSSEKE